MASIIWEQQLAEVHDAVYAHLFRSEVVGPMVDRLAELADNGPALELAVGTGRIALPLRDRGVEVHGIELSPAMVDQLRAKRGADRVSVTIGDMTSTRVPGEFRLVYLVANTIMNVTTQPEQVAVFVNAAAHLVTGGRFVVEVIVPQLRRFPIGHGERIFTHEPDHLGFETLDDPVAQITSSHHWMHVDGRLVRHSAPYRYVWPSELDLMATIAGLRLRDRWADWHRTPFTADSVSQVVTFEKTGG